MTTLNELINGIQNTEGYLYARQRATDHQGIVKCYTAWFQRYDDRVRDFEVRILVLDEGKPEEAAYLYDVSHITSWMTPPEEP